MELYFDWNETKNESLTEKYGFGFELIVQAIQDEKVLIDRKHPNKIDYPHQRQFLVLIEDYVYIVPYVMTDDTLFLKTFFPSRKATKLYEQKK